MLTGQLGASRVDAFYERKKLGYVATCPGSGRTDHQNARRVPERLAGIVGWTDYSWIDRIGHVRLIADSSHNFPRYEEQY